MLRLAISSLRYRVTSFAGSFLTLSLAVTVMAATGIVIQSGLQTVQTANPVAAASLIVASQSTWTAQEGDGSTDTQLYVAPERARVPANLVQQAQRVQGVRSAAGDLTFYAQAFTAGGQALGAGVATEGHPWTSASLAPWTLRDGVAPAGPGDVVLDAATASRAGVRAGDTVRVLTEVGRQEPFRVSGTAGAAGGVGAGRSVLFFSDATAARLAGAGGGVDFVGVIAEPGTAPDALAQRLRQDLAASRVQVMTPDEWRAQQPAATAFQEAVTSFGGILGLIGGFVSIFVLSSMFSLQVLQRRREIALLRAVGATPGQVRRMVFGEALIIGLASAAAGCLAAPFVGQWLGTAASNAGLLPGLVVVVGPLPLLVGAAAGIVVTLLAVLLAARRAAAIRPVEALRETGVESRGIGTARLVVGLFFTVGSLALELVVALVGGSQVTAGIAAQGFLLLTGLALLSPLLAPVVARLVCGPLARLTRATGRLARANSVANPRRTASAAAPLMLVTTLSALLFSIQATFGRIDAEQAGQVITADRVLSAGGGAPGLPPSAAREAGRLPGVASASGVASATVYLPQDANPDPSRVASWTAASALGVDTGMLDQVLRIHVQEGSLGALDATSIAVSAEGAPVDGLHAGQRLQLRMPDGQPVSVRVAAVLTGAAGVAQVLMPRALLASHVTQDLDQMVLVKARPGTDGNRLDADLEHLRASYPTLVVQRTASFLAGQNQSASTQSRTATYLVLGLGLLFAGVSTVNTLMVATAERAREFALLRLVGMRRWQLLRMIGWETSALVAFGLLGSVFVVAATMGATTWAYARQFFVEVPVDVYVIAGLAALLAVLSSLIPTQLALRSRPMDALSAGE